MLCPSDVRTARGRLCEPTGAHTAGKRVLHCIWMKDLAPVLHKPNLCCCHPCSQACHALGLCGAVHATVIWDEVKRSKGSQMLQLSASAVRPSMEVEVYQSTQLWSIRHFRVLPLQISFANLGG